MRIARATHRQPYGGFLPEAFVPEPKDIDGLSLYDLGKTSIESAVAEVKKGRGKPCPVVTVTDDDLRSVEVSIRQDEPPKGHVVLPELRYVGQVSDEDEALRRVLDMAAALAAKCQDMGNYACVTGRRVT